MIHSCNSIFRRVPKYLGWQSALLSGVAGRCWIATTAPTAGTGWLCGMGMLPMAIQPWLVSSRSSALRCAFIPATTAERVRCDWHLFFWTSTAFIVIVWLVVSIRNQFEGAWRVKRHGETEN